MSSLRITYKSFDQLTPAELYSILQLRSEVFVVEQNCVFQDMDGRDPQCFHVMINQPELIAYARLVPAGVYYKEMSVGRVITKASVRGPGIGKILMRRIFVLEPSVMLKNFTAHWVLAKLEIFTKKTESRMSKW
jgi:ElaA protein